MNLLWNGEKSNQFQRSRGIRQGDPLSLYIFVLCIERLAQLINMVVDAKLWDPIHIFRYGAKLSHLIFADDLVLLTKASLDHIRLIKGILDLFCDSSG